ncbi:MAG: TlpA family protein disulfide reductase [Firmicutes bacterium]|nr:TlpA family protein disulfide reductase [Bacillota bacterium]
MRSCIKIILFTLMFCFLCLAFSFEKNLKKAHSFVMPDISGNRVSLDDFKGKKVVLVFWAFWCDTWKDCRRVLAQLYPLQEEFQFNIVAVSIDSRFKEEVKPFIKKGEIKYPVLLDRGSSVSEIYKVKKVPTFYVISENQEILYSFTGVPKRANLKQIMKLLEAKP